MPLASTYANAARSSLGRGRLTQCLRGVLTGRDIFVRHDKPNQIGNCRQTFEFGARPGIIDTGIHASAGEPNRVQRIKGSIPMQRAGQPDEVARTILWLMSEEASSVTGALWILRVEDRKPAALRSCPNKQGRDQTKDTGP